MKELIKYKLSGAESMASNLFVGSDVDEFCDCVRRNFSIENSGGNGVVLIDALHRIPLYMFQHLLTGSYIAEDRKWDIGLVSQNQFDRELKRIGDAFGAKHYLSVFPRLSPEIHRKAISGAVDIFRSFQTRQELIDTTYDGTQVGDLIYNSYLRQMKKGTVSPEDKDSELLYFIYRHLLFHHIYRDMFDKYDINGVIVAHRKYSISGALLRVALLNDAEVFSFGSGSGLSYHNYTSIEENRHEFRSPSDELFEEVMQNHSEVAVKRGEEYLQSTINAEIVDDAGAYGANKDVITEDEVYERFNLSLDKPIAVVMCHAFTDGVVRGSWNLFPDYLTWLRNVLAEAVDIRDTNWLIKPHPNSKYYDCDHTVEDEVKKVTRNKPDHTLSIFPSSIDTKSLFDFADVVFTVRGTAGYEFPAFGIPSVIAGEAIYSGFDVAIEPESRTEYFDLLANVNEIEPVSDEQSERAKALFYMHKDLIGIESPIRSTVVDVPDSTTFWNTAATAIRNNDWENDPLYHALKKHNRKHSPVQHLVSDREWRGADRL